MDSPYQTLLSLKRGNTSLHVAAFMFPKIMKSLSCCTNCPMYSRKRLKGGFVATTSACSSNATHSRERKSPSPSRCTRELRGKANRPSKSNELSGRPSGSSSTSVPTRQRDSTLLDDALTHIDTPRAGLGSAKNSTKDRTRVGWGKAGSYR